jgi:hypothetical protein
MTVLFLLKVCIVLIVSVLLLTFLIVRYISKVYVDRINELEKDNEILIDFLSALQQRALHNLTKIREVDRRGSFSSDDEVGFVFTYLKNVTVDIYNVLNKYIGKK